MKRKNIIRVGDFVTVVVPRVVERVGYPLSYYDAYEMVQQDPRYAKIAAIIEGYPSPIDQQSNDLFSYEPKLYWRIDAKLRSLLAYQILQERGFGGKERKIHYRELSPFECTMYGSGANKLEVYSKRVVKTGTYISPSGGYDSYNGEGWYEPGGLHNEQTHILVKTSLGEFNTTDVKKVFVDTTAK